MTGCSNEYQRCMRVEHSVTALPFPVSLEYPRYRGVSALFPCCRLGALGGALPAQGDASKGLHVSPKRKKSGSDSAFV